MIKVIVALRAHNGVLCKIMDTTLADSGIKSKLFLSVTKGDVIIVNKEKYKVIGRLIDVLECTVEIYVRS